MDFDVEKISGILTEKLQSWAEIAVSGIPNFVAALLIVMFFGLLGKYGARLTRKLLPGAVSNVAVVSILATTLRIIALVVGLFIALGVLNLDKTVTSLLAGAGVLGLALGFAFQEIASNFVSGVLIAFRQPYRVGDIVEVDGFMGKVVRIDLRATVMKTLDGLNVFVPNKTMFTEPLINYTLTDDRRLEVRVGVSYGDDLDKAESLVKEACEGAPGRIKEKEIEVYYEEFGDSSINLVVFIWVTYPGDTNYWKTRHYAITHIKKIFEKNDITIPFPIRTLDFGIKGGEKLDTQLSAIQPMSSTDKSADTAVHDSAAAKDGG